LRACARSPVDGQPMSGVVVRHARSSGLRHCRIARPVNPPHCWMIRGAHAARHVRAEVVALAETDCVRSVAVSASMVGAYRIVGASLLDGLTRERACRMRARDPPLLGTRLRLWRFPRALLGKSR